MGVPGIEEHDDDDDIVGWFEGIAESAGATQRQTLRRIMETNQETEYLRKWLGSDIQELDPARLESLYTSSVPLASHADFEPYIQRIADGDTSPVLTKQPITMLSLSSGTTDGRPKYVPFTCFSSQSTLQIFRLAAAYRWRVLPIRPGGRILEFIYSSKQFQTKGGITAGTATTHYFASEEFKTKQKSTKAFTCSPCEVISGGDYKQSTYCHLLLGLVFADQVEFVASTFAFSIVQALGALEELWEELCEDIRDGTLSSRVTLPKMRTAVLDLLSPNPTLASEIKGKCRELKGLDWCCLIPELWPNAKYIYSIMTGSMLPYLKKLRHYAGGLPLVAADYGSTESWIGVNLEPSTPPERVTFTVIPTFAYFEFIPLSRQQKQDSCTPAASSDDFVESEPLPMSQVKVGEQYEIVVTTFTGGKHACVDLTGISPLVGSESGTFTVGQAALKVALGLYRYRLGDVVEVAGFYKGSPQLTFICRRKLILTVNIDKNTEKDLQLVVEKGSRLLSQSKVDLVDFTSHADKRNHPGHYIIYWEIDGATDDDDDDVLNQCCCEMDASFMDHGYVVSRRTKSIGPLELCIVARGTFRKIMEYYIANGTAMSQFKTPRCTSNQDMLRILDCCVVKRFWSKAYG